MKRQEKKLENLKEMEKSLISLLGRIDEEIRKTDVDWLQLKHQAELQNQLKQNNEDDSSDTNSQMSEETLKLTSQTSEQSLKLPTQMIAECLKLIPQASEQSLKLTPQTSEQSLKLTPQTSEQSLKLQVKSENVNVKQEPQDESQSGCSNAGAPPYMGGPCSITDVLPGGRFPFDIGASSSCMDVDNNSPLDLSVDQKNFFVKTDEEFDSD